MLKWTKHTAIMKRWILIIGMIIMSESALVTFVDAASTTPFSIYYVTGASTTSPGNIMFYTADGSTLADGSISFGYVKAPPNGFVGNVDGYATGSPKPLRLYIYNFVPPIPSGNTVSIITNTYPPTNPISLTIYLPELSIVGTNLYIANDGSTYYDIGLTQLAQSAPTQPDCISLRQTATNSISTWTSNPTSANRNNALTAIQTWATSC